jgi:hypothetical protein
MRNCSPHSMIAAAVSHGALIFSAAMASLTRRGIATVCGR